MKIFYFISYLSILFYSNAIFAQSIAVVNIQTLIDNNTLYKQKILEIENSQIKFLKEFEITEKELSELINEIEESKLILNQDEVNIMIENYNNKLNIFTTLIEKFNLHYQDQISIIRETILKEIIVLLEKYAIENNIDLMLDSTSYLIASNSIDITEIIKKQLSKIELNLKFYEFEKN